MVFKLAILCNLLLASLALAVPSFRRGARVARRQNHLNYTSNLAGVVVNGGSDGTFSAVLGTFTVPTPSGPDGAFSILIGIDGDVCQDAVLQTGVEISITSGVPSYKAWYESSPHSGYFSSISISGGDTIRAYAIANTTTSTGLLIIHNLSALQIDSIDIESSQPLCGYNAEWLVEDYMVGSSVAPFANFGNVQFSDAIASGPSKLDYSPYDGDIFDIQQNLQPLTSVTIDDYNITIQYI